MILCNSPVNTNDCFTKTTAFPNTWQRCDKCVCMQRLNTGCPIPLSLSKCLVKKDLSNKILATCTSKIPSVVIILLPLFIIILCMAGCGFCKRKKKYSDELQQTLNENTTL